MLLLRVLVDGGVDVRSMFLRINPALFEVMEFGLNPYLGAVILTALGLLMGAAAGVFRKLGVTARTVVVTAVATILLLSLGARLFIPMLQGLSIPTAWLYRSDALTPLGAVISVGAAVGIRLFLRRKGGFQNALVELPGVTKSNLRPILLGLVVAIGLAAPWIGKAFVADVLGTVGLYILLGLGLNIVVGYAGLLDLGYVAFYAVGAYTVALLTARSSALVDATIFELAPEPLTNFWVALPITIVVAVVIGLLIGAPVLRLRGDYLAIVTLGFGEIIGVLVESDWLKPLFGGPQGITEVADVPFFGIPTNDPQVLYYLIMGFALIAYFIATRLKDSRVGRAWAAMREDEDIAEGMGVSVIKYKLLAFAMGAAVGCLGGAFFPAKLGVANPGSFTIIVSINVLAVVVLGGMGSIPGVVVGSAILVGLPELLREFGEYRLHIYGAILVIIMILKPEGLIPDKRRALELHAEEPHESVGPLTAAATPGVQ
jgi:branched-chain amino acid transport system permease protein